MLRCGIKFPLSSERHKAKLKDELALHYDAAFWLMDKQTGNTRSAHPKSA
jgi:hypothetical protein